MTSVEREPFELGEADHDVGDLDSGVVDVVLDFDRHAAEAQDADERVAERGVPEMADVGRFVRIDRGVLDDRLAGIGPRDRRALAGSSRARRNAGRSRKQFK